MYSAFCVANAFIGRALDGRLRELNSMKLQKLMFFAQAWRLKKKGIPLFQDTFLRGATGPVLPSIAFQLTAYGSGRIGQFVTTLTAHDDPERWNEPYLPPEDRSSWDLIDAIIYTHGKKSPTALSDLTHLPLSAWSAAPADGSPILNRTIQEDPTIQVGEFE
ncbi:Panacea domain-containing protein [Roseateles noduli]|jgi:uncharacterized phage-associated protein|uniref:Panacea domain-containing protein n=1 Tax=Roseateles noduli TaxID=2052484 RepID=UPI003D64D1A7